MTTYSHNNLNQLTGIGGSTGVKTVVVRGSTSEPATVKVKPSIASVWKDARMLDGNRFESDLDLATGANQLNIQAKDGSGNESNYTYALNLAAATAAVPSHDDDGNMTSDGVRSYDWDSLSRLTKITWGAGSDKTTEYRYNALGQRSEQIEKSGTTETARFYYLYDGKDLLCRYTGGTAVANIDRQYLSQGEQRILTINNQPSALNFYYNRDHLGSIREVMNSDGTLAARYDYDPYGKRSVQYQSSGYTGGCDLGFTGHITQQSPVNGQGEIVLTFFRAYDPELGRWLSADPIGEAGGLNLYGYVGNDPLNAIDPMGLDAVICYGRNKANPPYFKDKAYYVKAAYEQANPGKKAFVFETFDYAAFSAALATPNIDRFDYWGHGARDGLFLGEEGAGVYDKNLKGLNGGNLTSDAKIHLVSCSSSSGGENSIAQKFADHFRVPVSGFVGGVGFGKWGFIMPNYPRGMLQVRNPGQTGGGTGTSTWPTWAN